MDEDSLQEIAERIEYDGRLGVRNARALVAEVRRLQGVEREALRVLGAIIVQHVQQRIDLPEEALRRDYTVGRIDDPATLTVRFRAELAPGDHEN